MKDIKYGDCTNFSYGDKEKDSFWFDCGICINMKCKGIGERCEDCHVGPDCKDFNCNSCINYKQVTKVKL